MNVPTEPHTIGGDDFGEEVDDAVAGVKIAAALGLAPGKLAEKGFV